MSRIYEGMFLIDNDAVRAGWSGAKSHVTGLIKKHGGEVHTARRWDERRLAYPIRHKNRATFMLAYFGIEGVGMDAFRRELDISETVMRYLITSTEAVPAGEAEKAAEESGAEFVVPEPPADDAIDEPEHVEGDSEEREGARARRKFSEDDEDGDDDGDDDDDDDDETVVAGKSKTKGEA